MNKIMKENNTVIKLDKVSKRFNVYRKNIERIEGVLFHREPAEVKHALQNVSFNIKRGERVFILGNVDSGRSTLLRVLSGITAPSNGIVNTFGCSMNVLLDNKAGTEAELTCRENIYLRANVVGLKKQQIEVHVDDIMHFAEADEFADLPMKRAPKGTVALLTLGVHLVYDADILLVDEVFGGGGSRVSSRCSNRMVKYAADNPEKTIIMVSNRAGIVKRMGTRALVLDRGRLVYDGNTEEALRQLSAISKRK